MVSSELVSLEPWTNVHCIGDMIRGNMRSTVIHCA